MLGVAAAVAGSALPAPAADVPDAYFLLGVAGTAPDAARGASHGLGGSAGHAWGLPGGLSVEGRLFANVLEADAPAAEAFSQEGLGIDLVVPLGAPAGSHAYVLAGGGGVRNDVSPDSLDGNSAFVNAGAGWRSAPRGELRYRLELRAISDSFDGGQLDTLLGFVLELGRRGTATTAGAPPAPTRLVRIGPPVPEAAIADADGDGIPDESDQCAQTLAGAQVEKDGCVWREQVVTLSQIRFATGSARLTADSRAWLDGVIAFFASQPDVTVDVYGHTDDQGDADYNLALSRQRAAAVRAYLVGKGVAPEQLRWQGFGKTRPVADNRTEAGRAKNRRVELHLHARQPG